MDIKKIFSLSQKTAAIISAALAALTSNKSAAQEAINSHADALTIEHSQMGAQKKQFVLKLNVANPDESFFAMHTSHRSHSSHVSSSVPSGHSSHSSHASHVSSTVSPSYTPSSTPSSSGSGSTTTPLTSPSSTSSGNSGKGSTTNTNHSTVLSHHTLGSRTIDGNTEGTDVKRIQELLIKKGYDLVATGFFDSKTLIAVKKFQQANHLKPDGKVGPTTLKLLQK